MSYFRCLLGFVLQCKPSNFIPETIICRKLNQNSLSFSSTVCQIENYLQHQNSDGSRQSLICPTNLVFTWIFIYATTLSTAQQRAGADQDIIYRSEKLKTLNLRISLSCGYGAARGASTGLGCLEPRHATYIYIANVHKTISVVGPQLVHLN